MDKTIYVISLILLSAVLRVNGLQCYVCDRCASVKDEHLQTCNAGSNSTTQHPTSTTPGSGTSTSSSVTTTTVSGGDLTTATTPSTTTASSNQLTSISSATTVSSGHPNGIPDDDLDSIVVESDILKADNDTTPYVCWRDSVTVNGTTVVSRGCGKTKTCEANDLSAKCLICEVDGCNSAHSNAVSAIILGLVSFLSLILIC